VKLIAQERCPSRRRQVVSFVIAAVIAAVGLPYVATAQAKRPRMLSCSPAILPDNGSLILHFALPHPTELSIEAPDGTIYFMVYDRNDTTPAGQTPLIQKASFGKMTELKLDVARAMGSPLVYGRNSNERVFRTPGTYKIVLADNIQSDADQDVYRCKVTLKSHP
jgi:hypothetical protein